MPTDFDKPTLRRYIRQQKARLTPTVMAQAERQVLATFADSPAVAAAHTILLYASLPDEVPTHHLLQALAGKQIILPRVVGDQLELRLYTRPEDLVTVPPYGIAEPTGPIFHDHAAIDLAIIPGMAFDTHGHRLGRGKGYYDRLFAQPTMAHITRIGLCFDFQVLPHIPHQQHDITMHHLWVINTQQPPSQHPRTEEAETTASQKDPADESTTPPAYPAGTVRALIAALLLLLTFTACKNTTQHKQTTTSGVFQKDNTPNIDDGDLESIHRSGELIIATVSSPTTYYDYHGLELGLHYALAQDFANHQGLSLRVIVKADTTELVKALIEGQADLIAYPFNTDFIDTQQLAPAGYNHQGSWAARPTSPALIAALNNWYTPTLEEQIATEQQQRIERSRQVTRKPQAVYLSRAQGVISVYDPLFKEASAITGWDWRLIAAMSYQESAFDPNAKSYAGARGLMQLMPATAAELGVPAADICQPEANVRAAARYIVQLINTFTDIRDINERLKFVLASYNGGARHIRDAMALTTKYGGNPHRWDDVAPYVLALQQPRYYRDPVVKYGYMIGSETTAYVQSILERWRDYGGNVAVTHLPQPPSTTSGSPQQGESGGEGQSRVQRRRNKYSSGTNIMSPDDPTFNQMNQ